MGTHQGLEKQQKTQSSDLVSASTLSVRGFSALSVTPAQPIAAPNNTHHTIQNIVFPIQTKPTIGQSNPFSEQEVDRVSEEAVQHRSTPKINQLQLKAIQILQRDLTHQGNAAINNIQSQDVVYEIIAHRLAYKGINSQPPSVKSWLNDQGYDIASYGDNWAGTVEGIGLFVGLLMPKEGSSKKPVLAFKGTTPSQLGDVLADLDPIAVGFTAFKAQQTEIKALIDQAGQKVDTVGHSLGGALAQQAASAFPGSINKVITFQAPGISQEQVRQFNALAPDQRPEMRHHIATGDVVDLAGGKHLGGSGIYTGQGDAQFFVHDVGMSPGSHTKYLLQGPSFANQRNAAGVTNELMQDLEINDKVANHQGVKQYNDNPFWEKQFITERARELASPGGALAIGGAALAKLGKQNFKKAGWKNKLLGVGGMAVGGAGALAGGGLALAGGALGGAIGATMVGASYVGQGIVTGAQAVGQGARWAGKKVASGAKSLWNAARSIF